MLGKVWKLVSYDNSVSEKTLVEQILSSRGIISSDDIFKFLNPSLKLYMPDPFVLQDMQKAVSIIVDAIVNKTKIAIYGDYDVDGITSTALFVKFFKCLDIEVISHLPTRDGEGYGLNVTAIQHLYDQGVRLLITVDCGISGINEIKYAKQLGMQVVVTDHHSPDVVLPIADAVVNPKRTDDTSGLVYLAGVGVAFFVLVALRRELKNVREKYCCDNNFTNINLLDYLDLVALGTICDTMPLIGVNRAFVATGLKVMDLRNNIGLKALMDIADIKRLTVYSVGFALGPRLNAAGRLDSAVPALNLLLTSNEVVAKDIANKLNQMNQDRINIQNAIMLDAIEKSERYCQSKRYSLYVSGDSWHGGVMGIIAGRLKDKYNLPSCVATKIDGVINGSGRSIPGVDLGKIIHDALSQNILLEGGGHAAAAGFTLDVEKEQLFCEFLEVAVREQLNDKVLVPEMLVDIEMDASGATLDMVHSLSDLEPFGQGNLEPVFVLNGAVLRYASIMGSGAHLYGNFITSNGNILPFVGFNLVGTNVGNFLLDEANTNVKLKILGKLKENCYNNKVSVQFVLEDIAIL